MNAHCHIHAKLLYTKLFSSGGSWQKAFSPPSTSLDRTLHDVCTCTSVLIIKCTDICQIKNENVRETRKMSGQKSKKGESNPGSHAGSLINALTSC